MARIVLASLALASAEKTFQEWQFQWGKVYNSDDENLIREVIYNSNVEMIEAHNAQNLSSTQAVNAFADLTEEEFVAKYTGFIPRRSDDNFEEEEEHDLEVELASSLDWCSKGACNAIRSQDNSDCWAFSTAGAAEGCAKAHLHTLPKLSEQFIIDCSGGGSAQSGGEPEDAEDWLKNHGFCSYDSYRYTGRDSSCKESSCSYALPKGTFGGVSKSYKTSGNPSVMRSALNKNPLSVFVHTPSMQFHSGGVITSACKLTKGYTNHAIVGVGYGSSGGHDYIKVRNSWGTGWGEKGYARIAMDVGASGAACILWDGYSYPTINSGSMVV